MATPTQPVKFHPSVDNGNDRWLMVVLASSLKMQADHGRLRDQFHSKIKAKGSRWWLHGCGHFSIKQQHLRQSHRR